MIALSDFTFQDKVLQNSQLTIVDFWAPWCGPCRTIAPILEGLSKKYEGRVTIGKLDIEENPKTTDTYAIKSIPTLIFFKNAQVVEQFVGLRSESDLETAIQKHL